MKKYLLIVSAVLAVAACGTGSDPTPNPDQENVEHTIVMSVSGPMRGNIKYDADSTINQEDNVSLPWTKQIITRETSGVVLVGSSASTDGSTIYCSITVDGRQVSRRSAVGAAASVTCDWSGIDLG